MSVMGMCFGMLVAAVLAGEGACAQEELMDFTGRERPGLMYLEASGLTRYRPDLKESEAFIRTINYIGEGFLDVETALPSPDLAARRPRVTPEILAAMDEWTNEYGRPWSVASYGGPLTPERMLAHTVRFNTGNIIYALYYSKLSILLELYLLQVEGISQRYYDANCPSYRENAKNVLKFSYLNSHHNNIVIYKYDWQECHEILYDWLRRNVSEVAGLGPAAAIGELFAWFYSSKYIPGTLPQEVEDMITSREHDSTDHWARVQYEGKRYEDIRRDLMANLERVNAGELPDSPEANVADYGTMLFLIATGRLLPPTTEEGAARP